MTHTYDETGKWLTVTRLALGPCTVLQSRNMEKDGYRAVQLSFGTKRNTTKPMAGHLKRAAQTECRFLFPRSLQKMTF